MGAIGTVAHDILPVRNMLRGVNLLDENFPSTLPPSLPFFLIDQQDGRKESAALNVIVHADFSRRGLRGGMFLASVCSPLSGYTLLLRGFFSFVV